MAQPRLQYFISHTDGTLVPLIPADELPTTIRLKGVPQRLRLSQTVGMYHVARIEASGMAFALEEPLISTSLQVWTSSCSPDGFKHEPVSGFDDDITRYGSVSDKKSSTPQKQRREQGQQEAVETSCAIERLDATWISSPQTPASNEGFKNGSKGESAAAGPLVDVDHASSFCKALHSREPSSSVWPNDGVISGDGSKANGWGTGQEDIGGDVKYANVDPKMRQVMQEFLVEQRMVRLVRDLNVGHQDDTAQDPVDSGDKEDVSNDEGDQEDPRDDDKEDAQYYNNDDDQYYKNDDDQYHDCDRVEYHNNNDDEDGFWPKHDDDEDDYYRAHDR